MSSCQNEHINQVKEKEPENMALELKTEQTMERKFFPGEDKKEEED